MLAFSLCENREKFWIRSDATLRIQKTYHYTNYYKNFTLSAGLFTVAGFAQMAIWAKLKHRAYKQDFKDYPKARKAILPFVL